MDLGCLTASFEQLGQPEDSDSLWSAMSPGSAAKGFPLFNVGVQKSICVREALIANTDGAPGSVESRE